MPPGDDRDLLTRLRRRSCADPDCKNPSCRLSREAVEEIQRLRLRLERDARTYATMQKGMESQAELSDGLKQRCRELEDLLHKIVGAEVVSYDDEQQYKRLFPGKEPNS